MLGARENLSLAMSSLELDWTKKTQKSRWPARLDVVQSASGLFLGLFMWGHMAFVSTILISKDAMWWVTRMFEGQFVIGARYPGIV
jgi:fumarate reductase subunit C